MSQRPFRPPYLQLSPAAKVELRSVLCEDAIGELEEVVEAFIPPGATRIGASREQLVQAKTSVDSLVEWLDLLPMAFAWSEQSRTFAFDSKESTPREGARLMSHVLELANCGVVSPRSCRHGARGIVVERSGKLHWIEMPRSELRQFSEDLTWLLDAVRSGGGRPAEAERDDQALAVAQVLQNHGIRPTKYRNGAFTKVLRIVLREAGYAPPDDLQPIVSSAVDRLRAC